MFGCTDASEVIREIDNCKSEFRDAKVRILGFDSKRQVQLRVDDKKELSNPPRRKEKASKELKRFSL
jgi:ribulose bisphosphate carboxylase small subunit